MANCNQASSVERYGDRDSNSTLSLHPQPEQTYGASNLAKKAVNQTRYQSNRQPSQIDCTVDGESNQTVNRIDLKPSKMSVTTERVPSQQGEPN